MAALTRLLAIASLVVAAAAQAQGTPPAPAKPVNGCSAASAHAFDFWIGEWNVTNPSGKLAGHSRIESILGGCALAEHWDGASGTSGVSYNAYDTNAKLWRQFWVDAQGSVLQLQGGLVGEKMVLQSPPSAKHVDRITWTPNADGSVRQFWETSEDGGKRWASSFDGTYRKAH